MRWSTASHDQRVVFDIGLRLTHAVDELGVRVAVLVVQLVVLVSRCHLLGRARDPFNLGPLLLHVLAKEICSAREIVEREERAAIGSVHRCVVLPNAGDQVFWEVSGLNGVVCQDLFGGKEVLEAMSEFLDILTANVIHQDDHADGPIGLHGRDVRKVDIQESAGGQV